MKRNKIQYSENVWLALVLLMTASATIMVVGVTMLFGIILILLGQNVFLVAFALLIGFILFKRFSKELKSFKKEKKEGGNSK